MKFSNFSAYNRGSDMVKSLKGVLSAIKRTGSAKDLTGKIMSVLKNEGLAGIIHHTARLTRNDYLEWINRYDTLSEVEKEQIMQRQSHFDCKPLISVIMPVYDPKPEWLEIAVESVRRQLYPNWELCIADDASTNLKIHEILNHYTTLDSRIKVVLREQNGHIAACSNSALELATGAWIALLDQDDEIASTALFWVADAINRFPTVKMIYSDEDKISKSGFRTDPYFKPDWNRELFYAQNMFSHLGVYHASLVKKTGCFREGFEGSQDYDLALRCIEHIDSSQIHHIPRVLYYWRIHNKSTAKSSKSKPYAMQAGKQALNDHFRRCNIPAEAQLNGCGYKISYALPADPPLVSIIICTRNGLNLIRPCIQSILELTAYPQYEIIIVDNGSNAPETLKYLDHLEKNNECFRVIRRPGSFNFSALNNQAVISARGKVVALLNNDVQVISKDWLKELVSLAIQPGIGAVGAKLYYADDTVQHAGIILGLGTDRLAGYAHNRINRYGKGYFSRANLANSFLAVTGACMVIRKSLYEQMKGFDEVNLPMAYNDVDFCLRLYEASYSNVFTPYAELYRGKSFRYSNKITMIGPRSTDQETEYFKHRWSYLIMNDPKYNPNLSLEHSDFSLAWPPRIEKI